MEELKQYINMMCGAKISKLIISNPVSKECQYKKIVGEKKGECFQLAKYTDKQVFHENISEDKLEDRLYELTFGTYKQLNGFSNDSEYIILISKKGKPSYKVKKLAGDMVKSGSGDTGHNRKKNYILSEGMNIAPLVDMGVFTKDGKVINAMYDKYKQINRFIEILNDEISH